MRTYSLLTALFGFLLLPGPARAYEIYKTAGGDEIHWPTDVCNIPYYIDPSGLDEIEGDQEILEVRRAMKEWGDIGCSDFYPSFISMNPDAFIGAEEGQFQNNVVFVPDSWAYEPTYVMLTLITFEVENGMIRDVDIAVNGQMYDFALCDTPGSENLVDYRFAILHEAGHFGGLAHSQEPEAVMYSGGQVTCASKLPQHLAADDIKGFCSVYDSSVWACDTSVPPDVTTGDIQSDNSADTVEDAGSSGGGGSSSCSFSDSAACTPGLLLLGLAGLLLAFLRRRRPGLQTLAALLATVFLAGACAKGPDPGLMRSPLSFLKTDGATFVVKTPPLSVLRDQVLGLVVNVEGAMGMLDLLRTRWSLDLADEDVFAAMGLDAASPLAAVGVEGGLCVGLDSQDPGAAAVRFRKLAEDLGLAWSQAADGTAFGIGAERSLGLVSTGSVLLLAVSDRPGAEDVRTLLALCAAKHFSGAPVDVAAPAKLELSIQAPGRFLPESAKTFQAPPPFGYFLTEAVKIAAGARALDLGVLAGKDGLVLDIFLHADLSAQKILAGTAPAAPLVDSTTLVPADTAGLLRLSAPGAQSFLGLLGPGLFFALDFYLKAQGVKSELYSPALTFLKTAAPRVELLLFGLVQGAAPEALLGFSSPEEAPALLDAALLLHGDTAVLKPFVAALAVPGYKRSGLEEGDFVQAEFCKARGTVCWGLLLGPKHVFVISGKGRAARLLELARGRTPSLASVKPLVIGQGLMALNLRMKTWVRELRSRGVPPFYLDMLDSFLELGLDLSVQDKGLAGHLEVLLR